MNISVVAKICCKDGLEEELFKELKILHEMTHKLDEGCLQYDLHQDIAQNNTFIFIETWQNAEALAKHEVQKHYLTAISALEHLVDSVEVYKTNKRL